jgi:glutamate N-acetyltransferase/amino-acid N-acetyltransferase
VDFDPNKVDLYIGANRSVQLLDKGQPTENSRNAVKKEMQSSTINIHVDLNEGTAEATGWGSDLSYEYIRINAEYTT